MAHLVVEHGEEAKQKVESDDVGQVERNVPAVREQDSGPLSFFQVDNAFVGNDTLTDKTNWVERDPQGVPKPCQQSLTFVVDAENIVGVPWKRTNCQIAFDDHTKEYAHLNTSILE